MKRLTKRCINGIDISNASHKVSGDNKSLFNRPEDYLGIVVSRLADYEDAEEQGLLVKLPCKVGDTVYVSRKNSVLEEKVEGYNQSGVDVTYECDYDCEGCPHFSPYTNYEAGDGGCDGEYGVSTHKFEDFGKAVFLTRKAAEAALKEEEAGSGTD